MPEYLFNIYNLELNYSRTLLLRYLLYGDRAAAVESDIGRFLLRPYGGRMTAVRRPHGRSQYFRGRRLAVEF